VILPAPPSGGGPRDAGAAAWDNPRMEGEPRRLRADAERNRRRLIDAATAMFSERGLEVSVGEIAERAGVGRGTLFRNFPSKDALITAVVAERIRESVARGRARLDEPEPVGALFGLIDEALERQASDRALFEALADTWMAHPEIRAAHHELLAVTEELVTRAQAAGAVREDVSAVDVVLMVKGVCEVSLAFQQVDPEIARRQLDLVKAAISAPGAAIVPLRGRPPTADDLERAHGSCTAGGEQPAEVLGLVEPGV
jgi:AcrR family transcriptional regulator